jgi:YD repeat-containing protein
MVAIVTGRGTGLERSSAWVLGSRGQLGSSTLGRDGEGVYVNAANGNLVITRQDEFLLGLGPDISIDRTYNSQATVSDGDNGDKWRMSPYRKVTGLSGSYGGGGTTVTRIDWDGSDTLYTWNATYIDATHGAYVATDGAGAYDMLTRMSGVWTWTDGDTQGTETYDDNNGGRIAATADADGNSVTYTYNQTTGLLTRVTSTNGSDPDEYTNLVYDDANHPTWLTRLETCTNGVGGTPALTRTRYAYLNDGTNRLSAVTVDLSPADNSTSDGKTYVTTYTYDGGSTRVASIAQQDGSLLQISYVEAPSGSGVYKVASYTQTVAAGVTRTTYFSYGSDNTVVTDPAEQKTILWYNGNGELKRISYPPENSNTTPRVVEFDYDVSGDGDVTSVTMGPGNRVDYSYDARGNRTFERDRAGNTITRKYSNPKNELLTETRYLVPDPDGNGSGQPATPLTSRYAYDGESHLRFMVSAEGMVTEYRYDTPGRQTVSIAYTGATYDLTGLGPTNEIDRTALENWVTNLSDKSAAQRTETSYDYRGAVATVRSYSKLLSNGEFDTSSELSLATYTYSQAGNLLTRVLSGSAASEVFVYDGLGRMTQATDFNGAVTKTFFLDSLGQTVLTHANGLSQVSTYNRAGELIAFSESNAGGNLVDVTGWPGNPGSVPSGQATVAGWVNHSDFTDETRWASTLGPDGLPVVAIQAGQLDGGQEGGGNHTNEIAIDETKAYEFSWQFKLSAMDKHHVFFGLSGAPYVENLNDGLDNANPYFWYAYPGMQDAYLDPDKWYKVVGYVLPQGTPTSSAPLGGVYDVATGQKVLDIYSNFRWNPERPGNTVHSRFFDYYGTDYQNYSTYFLAPEVRQVSTASVLGPDAATSLYRYDNLGRLRMTVDPTGRRNYLMYDSVGRKAADIDADGSVIEYRYDGSDNLTSTTRYVNRLSSGQIASLLDANGNPTSAAFASLRPSAHADDQWTFQVYDAAQRLIQTIDGTGATSVFTYDGASRLTSTKSYANKLSGSTLTTLKAEATNPNNWANPNDGTLWAYYNLTQAAASPIDGANAYQFTVQASSWEAMVGNVLVTAAGDTVSVTLSMKAVGSTTTNSFGLYGAATGWGDYSNPDARGTFVSGPGTFTQSGSYFYIQGLSTTEATRFTITRTLSVADTIQPYLYVRTGDTFASAAGASTILAAPVMSRLRATPYFLPTADAANDRTTRNFYDADGRAIASLDGAGGLTQFVYDKSGRKIRELGSANAAASNLWAAGTLAQLIASAGTSASDRRVDYVYDARGYLRFTIDAAARPIEMVYDGAGRVIRTVEYAGSIAAASSYSLAYVTAQLSSTGLATNGGNRIKRSVYDAAGQRIFGIDATGAVTAFAYDNVGNVIKQTHYANPYTVAGDQSLATMQSWATGEAATATNRVSRSVYDVFGRVAYTVDGEGYVSERQYDRAGRVTKDIGYAAVYTVADGVTKTSLAVLIGSLPASAVVATYAYDADGLLSDTVDGTGAVTHFTYDSFGQAIDTIVAYGTAETSTLRRAYDVLGRVVSETRAFGTGIAATTSFAYDALGNLTSVTDPRGFTTTRTYDKLGRVVTVSVPVDGNSANKLVTTSQYDAFGNLAKVSQSALADNANSYRYFDTLGRLVLDIDAERFWTRTAYTAFGDVATVTRGYVGVASEPDVGSQPTTPTDAKDATTSFTYDLRGRVKTVTDAEGHVETYWYSSFGERVQVVNKAGGLTQLIYDRVGRLNYEWVDTIAFRADGTVQSNGFYDAILQYDSRGNTTYKVEAYALTERRNTSYVYDKANRVAQIVHDQVQVVADNLLTTSTVTPSESFTYNARGELIQSVDAGGGKTLSYYDALGRKTAEVNAAGTLSGWTYDANGNALTARVYGDAVAIPGSPGGTPPSPVNASNYRETGFTYDRANRLATTTIANLRTGAFNGSTYAVTVGNVASETVYSRYRILREDDGNANSSWTWFDKLGRKIAQVDREKYLTVWELDTNGNARTETRYAAQIGATITETTAAASLPGLAGAGAADRTTSFTYDKNGRRLTETRVGVFASSVSGTGALSSSTQSATITYTYNPLGLVASKTEANGNVTDFEYYNSGRLKLVKEATFTNSAGASVRPATETFYDALGNVVRTEVNKDGGATSDDRVTTFAYGAGGRLTSTTDAVNFTRYFEYDAAGRVAKEKYTRVKSDGSSVTEAIGYRYDLAGRLVTQAAATWNGSAFVFGVATRLRYNAFGEVSGTGLTGGPGDTAVYQEVTDYDEGGRVWRSTAGDGTIKIMLYDKAGNLTLTLSSTGADLSGYTAATAAAAIASAGGTSIANAVTAIAMFDKRGLQTKQVEPDRQLSSNGAGGFNSATITVNRTYNAFGEVLSESDARNSAWLTDYTYNSMGRLTRKERPAVNWTSESGAVASARPTDEYYYDVSGRLVGVRDANGNLTTRALVQGTGHGGAEALVYEEYHPDSGVAKTYYDDFREAVVLRDELGSDEVRYYDKMGRVWAVTQRGGLITDYYTNDALGRRTRHYNDQLGSSVVERTDYDVEGRVTATIDMAGGTTSYGYSWDAGIATTGLGTFGGWTKTTTLAGAQACVEKSDLFGRTTYKSDFGSHAFSYTYDKGGRLTAMSGPSSQSMTNSWLNTGRLYQLVDAAGTGMNAITAKYGYDAAGNRTYEGYSGTVYSFNYPSGTTSSTLTLQNATIAYDAMGRITSFTDKDAGGTTRITVTNEYDKNGNVRRTQSSFPNLAAGSGSLSQDKWYKYDSMNRMVLVDGTLSSGQIVRGSFGATVAYDAAGRRRTQTKDAGITGYSYIWVWYPGHGPGSQYGNEFPEEGVNGDMGYVPYGFAGERREDYEYRADGALANVKFAETGYTDDEDGTVTSTGVIGTAVLRSEFQRDAMGRLTRYREFSAPDGYGTSITTHDRNSIVYDARGNITSESVSQLKVEGPASNIYVTNTVNSYTSDGRLSWTSADQWKNGHDEGQYGLADTRMDYSYAWYDGARIASTTYDFDTANSGTNWTSTYYYDGIGRLASVGIDDQRDRTVSFAYTPEGQILNRKERSAASANPEDQRNFVAGAQVGELTSDGNSDPTLEDYARNLNTIRNWTPNPQVGAFRWNTTAGTTRGTFGAGGGYEALNPYGAGTQSAGSSYTVRDGETLQSIAAGAWGDANLWYLIAEANGLSAGSGLIGGQSLIVPDRVTDVHNNAGTFKVYDPAAAMGDLSPTTAKPPKKPGGCGAAGQIIATVIAVVVSKLIPIPIIGPVIGNLASQAFLIAIGQQSKINWKSVAITAISAGLAPPGTGNILADVVTSAAANAATQGIAVATGLQDKFSWAGVATAGAMAGVSGLVGRALPGAGAWDAKGVLKIAPSFANATISSVIAGIAGAGARSILTGTSFGDNVRAVLPDVIAQTAGNMIGMSLQTGFQGSGSRGTAKGNSTAYDGDGIVEEFEYSGSSFDGAPGEPYSLPAAARVDGQTDYEIHDLGGGQESRWERLAALFGGEPEPEAQPTAPRRVTYGTADIPITDGGVVGYDAVPALYGAVVERYGDSAAQADWAAGRKVVFGFRVETGTLENGGNGQYDDAIVVAWRDTSGAVSMRVFAATTEPAGAYRYDGPRAGKVNVDIDRDGRADLARLMPGNYRYSREYHPVYRSLVFRSGSPTPVERDINQDGLFNAADGSARVDRSGAGRTILFHPGGSSFTGSAGCQTMNRPVFQQFLATLGRQTTFSYILVPPPPRPVR